MLSITIRSIFLLLLSNVYQSFKIKSSFKLCRIDCLSNNNVQAGQANDLEVNDVTFFAGIKYGPPISKTLSIMGISEPTPIQKASIGPLTAGVSAILHAETGSGKTFCYLLPLIKRLMNNGVLDTVPLQALIIVPTKELAVQITSDIHALTSYDNTRVSPAVHLCLTNPRSGFDEVRAPIIVGTPFKILDALSFTSPEAFSTLSYLVLDEVDGLIQSVSKYASNDAKRRTRMEDNPTVAIVTELYQKFKVKRENLQIVAASATVGRPLRRDLYRLINSGNIRNNEETKENGDFLVIRAATDIQADKIIISTDDINSNQPRSSSSSSIRTEERVTGSFSKEMTRLVGVPSKIIHKALLYDDVDEPKTDGSNNNDNLIKKLSKAKDIWLHSDSKRALLFVPHVDDVQRVLGVLKFWGVSEAKDLQTLLGINSVRPTSAASNNNNFHYNNRKNFDRNENGFPNNEVKQIQRKSTSEMIRNAVTNRIGAAAIPTTNNINDNSHESYQREIFVLPVSGSRGLHVQEVDYVYILQTPKIMDEYLHMAGRTGRAGGKGTVLSFVNFDEWKRLQSWQTGLGISFDVKSL